MLLTSHPVKITLLRRTNGRSRVTCRQSITLGLPGERQTVQFLTICVISGFPRDVNEICTLLGLHAAHSGSSGPTVRGFGTIYRSYFQVSVSSLDT
jgi:hypothetical protein